MKTPDILKFIEYKITSGSGMFESTIDEEILKKYKLKNEIRNLEYQDYSKEDQDKEFEGDIVINEDKVLRITLGFPDKNGIFRWTNEKYNNFFEEMADLNNYNDNRAYDDIYYTDVYLLEEMLDKIQAMMMCGNCSYEVTYPIQLDDKFLELATIAANKEGIKVDDWIAKCIKDNQSEMKIKKGM